MTGPEGRRLLLTAFIGEYDHSPPGEESWNRPQLAEDVDRMVNIMVNRLEYEHVPLGGPRLTKEELRTALHERMAEVRPEDYVVVYLTGHGVLQTSGDAQVHWLLPSDADPARPRLTYLPTTELVTLSVGNPDVRRLMIILDTCYSGGGAADFMREAMPLLREKRSEAGLPDGAGLVVISSSLKAATATAGLFTRAFHDAVLKAWPESGARVISVSDVMKVMERDAGLAKARAQLRILSSLTRSEPEFLRVPGVGRSPAAVHYDARREMADDASILVEAAPDFVGRWEALHRLVRWLDHPRHRRTAVLVRGKIGAGKTAVLGAFLRLADPSLREALPADWTERFPQPTHRIDVVIHLRTKPTGAVVGRIAGLLRPDTVESQGEIEASVDSLLRLLHERRPDDKPLTVLIDAIDEATNPKAVIEQVIAPLTERGRGAIRLVLGARTNVAEDIIALLGDEAVLQIDLDAAGFTDLVAMRTLISQRLARAGWYDEMDTERRRAVVEYLAESAARSFLVAVTTADNQAERADPPDPDDEQWRAGVPRDARAAVAEDFDRHHFGPDRVALLRPLAYAQGRGLPFQDIWPALALALAPDLDHGKVEAELRRVIRDASSYLVATVGGSPRYTLEHSAFAEFLRDRRSWADDQRVISEALLERVRRLMDGRRNWAGANPYIRDHLSSHAAAGGLLDDLVLDPGFLVSTEPLALLEALGSVTSPDARAAADAYRRALPLLRGAGGAERIGYLALAAHELGATALAGRITREYQPMLDLERSDAAPAWLPVWAAWRPDQPHLSLTGGAERLLAVHGCVVAGRPALISVDVLGTTIVWDPAIGTSRPARRTPGPGAPSAAAFLWHAGRTMVVSADESGTVWWWDPLDEAAEPTVLYQHPGTVTALTTWAGPEPRICSAGTDGTLQVWDPDLQGQIEELAAAGTIRAIAVAKIDGSLRVAAGGEGSDITVWDLGQEYPGAEPVRLARLSDTRALAFAGLGADNYLLIGGKSNKIDVLTVEKWELRSSLEAGGFELDYVQAIAVEGGSERVTIAAGGDDGIVRLWDLASLEHAHAPLVGHEATVTAVGWVTVDGHPCVVSGGADGALRVWNAADYPPAEDPFVGHSRVVRGAAVTVDSAPDPGAAGKLLATVGEDQSVRIWDLDTGEPVGLPLTRHGDWVGDVAFARVDGRTLVVSVGGDGKVRVWEAASGLPDGEPLAGHTGWIGAVAVATRNGDPVALTAGRDGRVLVWNLRNRGEPDVLAVPPPQPEPVKWEPPPLRALAVAGPQDAPMVLAAGDSGQIQRWFLPTGTALDSCRHGSRVNALIVCEVDGRHVVASGGDDGTVRLWDAERLHPTGIAIDHKDSDGDAAPAPVTALAAVTLADRTVILSGGDDACVRGWHAGTGEPDGEVFREHHRTVRALAVHRPDGDQSDPHVISGGGDGVLHLSRLGESAPISHARVRHAGAVHALAGVEVRPRGGGRPWAGLVSGSADRSIRLWRWEERRGASAVGKPLLGHQQVVRTVAAKTMGSDVVIVTGGDDGAVRVWKLDGAGGIVWQDTLSGHRHRLRAVALDRTGQEVAHAVSGDGSGAVRLWRITTEAGAGPPLPGEPNKQVRALVVDNLARETTVFAGYADGVRAWHLNQVRPVRPLWDDRPIGGVAALVTAELGTREVVLIADDNARVWVRDRGDGRVLGPPLPVQGPATQALAAVRRSPRLRVAVAAGDRLQIATLAHSGVEDSITWTDDVTLSTGSKALALAWIDGRTIAVGCEMGIVVLELRNMTAGG